MNGKDMSEAEIPKVEGSIWIASYTASKFAGVLSRGLLFRSIHDSKEEAEKMSRDPQALDFTVTEYVPATETAKLQAELAETQRRLHEANEHWLGANREYDSMSHRYEAAAEMNKRLLEQIKAYRVSAKLVHGAKDTQYIDELIEQAEAALAKVVPHV